MIKSIKNVLKKYGLNYYLLLLKYKCNSLKTLSQKKKEISKNFILGERIATSGYALLAMTALFDKLKKPMQFPASVFQN